MSHQIPRRRLIATLGGALATPYIRPAHAAMESDLVIGFAGGDTQHVFERSFFPDFAARTGIKAHYLPGQPADIVARVQAQKSQPQIDLVFLTGAITYFTIDQGLLGPIDRTRLPNLQLIDQRLDSEPAIIPIGATADALVYNKDIIARNNWPAPSDWLDMWNPNFKGHVGISSINTTGSIAVLVQIAKELTGDDKNLDAAFAKYRALRPSVLDFFPSAGAWETAMQQGALWIGTNSATRAMQLTAAGYPIGTTFPASGIPGFILTAGIVKNAPHPNAAHAWINYMLSTEIQQRFAELIGYIPINPQAQPPAANKYFFPDLEKIFIPDWRYLGAQLPAIVDRWNKEVER